MPLYLLKAQVACNYQFSYSSNSNYSAIPTAASTITLAAGAAFPTDPFAVSPTDEDFWPNQTLGFNFTYNGTIYNQCGIATNGWIWFGNINPVKAGGVVIPFTNVLAGDAQMQGIISALNADLQGRWNAETATIKTHKSGASPNRKFTIEWKNFKANDPGEGTGYCGINRNRFDFQITLCELNNQIEFAYNVDPYCYQGYNQLFQVGLRGASKADVHARLINPSETGWQESSLGFSNSNAVIRSSAPITKPAANARFVFTPGPSPELIWVGTNNNWWNANNWLPAQVPMRCNNVSIPAGRNYYPELSGNKEAQCRNITIQEGAAITIKSNYQSFLGVYGNLVNQGVLVNNTNNYISLAGGDACEIAGQGSFLGADLFITRNSNYKLQNDLVIRRLFIKEGSELNLQSHTLDVFSLVQEGILKQGSGLLVIEGSPDMVSLNDSTFLAQQGTTFFGNGELWSNMSNQTVPSANYNHLWVRTNKNHTVQLGTHRDFDCQSLLFYNPGEAGGIAETAKNININSHLKLGIDSLPGTFFKIHHQLKKNGSNGVFDMGQQDQIDVIGTSSNINQSAIQGYPQAVFKGKVNYQSSAQQVIIPGTYHNLNISGNGTRTISNLVKIAGILKVNDGTLITNDSLTLSANSNGTGLISGAGSGNVLGNVKAERYVGEGENWIILGSIADSIQVSNWRNLIISGASGQNWSTQTDQIPTVWQYQNELSSEDFRTGFQSFTNASNVFRLGQGYLAKTSGQPTISISGQVTSGLKQVPINEGFNLISNPYPSPIDWKMAINQQSQNLGRVLFTYSKLSSSDGQYAAYLPLNETEALSVNGGSSTISMLEGFMVKSLTTDTFRFNNSQRTEIVQALPQQTNTSKQVFKIRLENESKTDETLIFFDVNGNNANLQTNDIEKLAPLTKLSSIATIKNNKQLVIQSRALFTEKDSIPLSISCAQSGYYKIKLADLINIEPTAMIYLQDKLLNTFHNLRVNGYYQAYLSEGEIANRFVIQIKAGVLVNSVGESCTGNDGLVHLTNNSGTAWNYSLYNAADSLIAEINNFLGNNIYQNLKGGEYKISFSSVEGNYTVDQYLQVGLSNKVKAEMHASITQAKPGDEITFTSLTEGATGYFWDFADGMMLTGDSIVQHSFESEGAYRVVLRAHKNECSDTTSATIYVSNEQTVGFESLFNDQTALELFPNPARDQAQWTINSNDRIELLQTELVDMKGQTIKQYQFKNVMPGDLLTIDINEVATGMYYVVSRAGQYKAVGKLQVVK